MKRVLITGITGMIGSNIARALIMRNQNSNFTSTCYEVYGLVRYRSNLVNLAGLLASVHILYGDLTDVSRVRDIVKAVLPHYIYHFGAQAINDASFTSEELTYSTNVMGTSNLLSALRGRGSRVLVASSSTVYGRTSEQVEYAGGQPIPETASMSPASPYGVSKSATELMCLQQTFTHGEHCVAARLFIHVSPGGTENLALQEFSRQVALIEIGMQEPFIMHGNLNSKRDTTDVRDSANQLVHVLELASPGEVYNIGSFMPPKKQFRRVNLVNESFESGVLTGKELLKLVTDQSTVKNIELRLDVNRLRAFDESALIANNSKLRTLTGWQPQNDLSRTVKDILNYWRAEVRRRYTPKAQIELHAS